MLIAKGRNYEYIVYFALFFILVVIALIGNYNDANRLPNEIKKFESSVDLLIEEDTELFFRFEAEKDVVYCFLTDGADDVDTLMTLFDSAGNILQFSDDISALNLLSMICLEAPLEDLILSVKLFNPKSEGNVTLSAQEVKNVIDTDSITEIELAFLDIYFGVVSLEENTIYDFIAFTDVEFDSAIRIRTLDGAEVAEAFRSTITELSARTLFVAPKTEKYIIEVRQVATAFTQFVDRNNDNDLRRFILKVLVASRTPEKLEIDRNDEKNVLSYLTESRSTLYEVDLPPNISLTFKFDLGEVDSALYDVNTLLLYNVPLFLLSTEVFPGISLRFYDKESSSIIYRDRSELDFEFNDVYLASFDVNDETQRFPIVTFSTQHIALVTELYASTYPRSILIDLLRFNPNYNVSSVEEYENSLTLFRFDFNVTSKTEILDGNIVNDLDQYPDCNINPSKLTFNDGSCDQGIVLFCRNEFFPKTNISNAAVSSFSDICECVEFLCVALVSGSDVGQLFFTFKQAVTILLLIFSFILVSIYFCSVGNLCWYGDFDDWLYASNTFKSWTITVCFFVVSINLYFARIFLNYNTEQIRKIDDDFSLERIPNAADRIPYSYYQQALYNDHADFFNISIQKTKELLDQYYYDSDLGNPIFFEEQDFDTYILDETSKALSDSVSVSTIERFVVLTTALSGLKNFIAMVSFLDVALVWVNSIRKNALNRFRQQKHIEKIRRFILVLKILSLLTVVIIIFRLIMTRGQSYTPLPSIIILILAFTTLKLFFLARFGLKFYLVDHKSSTLSVAQTIWWRVKFTSGVIICCLFGVCFAQIYLIIKLKSFEELLSAGNDVNIQNVFLFNEVCVFIGQGAVFFYLFLIYLDFRDTLFEDITVTQRIVQELQVQGSSASLPKQPQTLDISQL